MPNPPESSKGFQGLRVVSFESRNSKQMADLIRRNGGEAILAPSMREVPLEENREALIFGEKLLKKEIDIVLLLTGVGTRTLFQVLETRHPRATWVQALSETVLVARGPKPVAFLREIDMKPTITVPEPNTWKQVLQTLDQQAPVQGKTVAVQEYGVPNRELIEGLAQRGARIVRVPIYRWAMPENTEPLRQALQTIIEGEADVVLFTNGNQINNVLQLAQQEGIEPALREALAHMVVASVGPVCSHFLDEYGLPVDMEPEHPKMGNLVLEASRKSPQILEKKRIGETGKRRNGESSKKKVLRSDIQIESAVAPILRFSDSPSLQNSPFLRACRRERTPYTPIWLMRQAGRYMKEYRTLREQHGFLELCKDSDLACEVTVYAVERLGVDAAIIFSDILVLLEPMGLKLEYARGDGPIIHNPVRSRSDIQRLRVVTTPEPLQFVMDAIRKTRQALKPAIPLIGFAGAPFTLASYMIEGQGSRNYIHTKSLMHSEPEAWHALLKTISESLIVYLNAQIAAGAQAVQLFDSWVGCLSPEDYKEFVLPHTKHVVDGIKRPLPVRERERVRVSKRQSSPQPSPLQGEGVPIIHFGTGTSALLELMKEAGGDVIGLDWRVELDAAWKRLGNVAVMGNLDPVTLFAEIPEIRRRAKHILDQAAGRTGHIFNLGHGILPNTPVGHVKALVDIVHELSANPHPNPLLYKERER